jgi:type II secretory pathway pseudopilin PulG
MGRYKADITSNGSPPAGRSDRHLQAEDGFTIVEAIVAMALVALLFVGLSATLLTAVRHQRDIRLHQQAVAISQDHVEIARSATWTQLELSAAPDATIPHHAGGAINGAFFELASNEPLVVDPGVYTVEDPDAGLIDPGYATSETVNGVRFNVYQYVTEVEPGLRRVTVLVEWNEGTRSYVGMTLINELGAG